MKKPLVGSDITVPQKPSAPANSAHTSTMPSFQFAARLQSALVWLVWTAMFVAAIFFVRSYGSNVPGVDEWHLVPKISGHEPVTLEWLWASFNEHRVLVPRLVTVMATRLANYDFRAGMYLNVAALAGLAFAMILTARKLRGCASFTDVFFPLILLHLGHWQNFLQGWNVQGIAVTVLSGTLLILMALNPSALTVRKGIVAGLCVIVLPFCGAGGAAVAIPIGLWLLLGETPPWAAANISWNPRRLLIGGMAAAAFCFIWFGYVLEKNTLTPGLADRIDATTLWTAAKNGLRVLSMGFGPGMQSESGTYVQKGEIFLLGNYPPEPQAWPVSGFAALFLLTFSTGLLALVWYVEPTERFRALRLSSIMCAIVILALAIGWGRSMEGPNTMFRSRYAAETAPLWCTVYFIGTIYGSWWAGRVLCVGSLLLVCLLSQGSFEEGVYWGKKTRAVYEAFERDLSAGMPADLLAENNYHRLHIWFHPAARSEVETSMLQLAKAGGRWARDVVHPSSHREVEIPIVPTSTSELALENGVAYARGNNPCLTYSLTEPTWVGAIRIKLSLFYGNTTPRSAAFRIGWREHHSGNTTTEHRPIDVDTSPGYQTLLVWVNGTIDQFEILPDHQLCVIDIRQIVLIVPESKQK